jgi:N-acetylmuramoyl-L-alanine amidase
MASLWWAPPAGATSVRVRPGQNLTQIAAIYGTTVGALASANAIRDPNVVEAGTVLAIPSARSNAAPTGGTVSTGGAYAVAAPGDSLWSIATRNGTTVAALARANGIAATSTILIGRRLVLPAGPNSGVVPMSLVSQRYPAALLASSSRLTLLPLFRRWATHFGVPASLLEGTCWWESGWQTGARSPTGAVGIGQLEPATVTTLRSVLGDPSLSATDASDNIEMAAGYLHQLLAQTGGNQRLALAGYYQGMTSVRRSGMLPSTVQYVQGVLATSALFS